MACLFRSPQDKGRVEAGVKFVQVSFFAGEQFAGIADAQRRAEDWCRVRAGMRVHGTTRRRPAEVFAELAECGRPQHMDRDRERVVGGQLDE